MRVGSCSVAFVSETGGYSSLVEPVRTSRERRPTSQRGNRRGLVGSDNRRRRGRSWILIGGLAGYNVSEARTLAIGIIGATIAFALGAGGVAGFHALSPVADISQDIGMYGIGLAAGFVIAFLDQRLL